MNILSVISIVGVSPTPYPSPGSYVPNPNQFIQVLTGKLSVGNISEMAWLAINHDCSTTFKDEIIAFIKDNREELNQSLELRQVLMSDSKMLWKLSVLYTTQDALGPS